MNYSISPLTLALIPKGQKTRILETANDTIVDCEISDIIQSNCICYGSTLDGRIKASSFLLCTKYKPPIVISERQNIILIPTHSLRNTNGIWLNLSNILNYLPIGNNKVEIVFINNQKLTLNISFGTFDKQVLRAIRLESILRGRIYQNHL